MVLYVYDFVLLCVCVLCYTGLFLCLFLWGVFLFCFFFLSSVFESRFVSYYVFVLICLFSVFIVIHGFYVYICLLFIRLLCVYFFLVFL